MMNKITLIIFSLLLITTVSAIELYAGENYEIELDKPYEYYSIVGNSTPVNLEVIQVGNNVTITTDKYSPTDTYEIIFFDSEEKVITVHSGGGGGGGTRYVYRNQTVEVPTYVDREVIKEVDGEIIEVETVIRKIPTWVWIVIVVLLIIGTLGAISLGIDYVQNRNERRSEQDE